MVNQPSFAYLIKRSPIGVMKRLSKLGHYFLGWSIVSYDHRLLCGQVSRSLLENPSSSLCELSRMLSVSCRTIQNAVGAVTGKHLRGLRDELLCGKVESVLVSIPNISIRQLSLKVGYKSSRSFARAIRRVCGISPRQLRARFTGELPMGKSAKSSFVAVR